MEVAREAVVRAVASAVARAGARGELVEKVEEMAGLVRRVGGAEMEAETAGVVVSVAVVKAVAVVQVGCNSPSTGWKS